jgi:hypothetical protein
MAQSPTVPLPTGHNLSCRKPFCAHRSPLIGGLPPLHARRCIVVPTIGRRIGAWLYPPYSGYLFALATRSLVLARSAKILAASRLFIPPCFILLIICPVIFSYSRQMLRLRSRSEPLRTVGRSTMSATCECWAAPAASTPSVTSYQPGQSHTPFHCEPLNNQRNRG